MKPRKWKITDEKPGGSTLAMHAISPPHKHPGYAVVVSGAVVSVCKYYGRAEEEAGRKGGFVASAAMCERFGYKLKN